MESVTTGSIYNISHGIAWCVNDYSIFRDSAWKQNDTCKCSNVDVGHIYDRIFDCYNNDSRTVAYAVCKHMEKAKMEYSL